MQFAMEMQPKTMLLLIIIKVIFFSRFIITSEYDKPFKLDLFKTSHEAGIMKQFIFVFRNVQSNGTI